MLSAPDSSWVVTFTDTALLDLLLPATAELASHSHQADLPGPSAAFGASTDQPGSSLSQPESELDHQVAPCTHQGRTLGRQLAPCPSPAPDLSPDPKWQLRLASGSTIAASVPADRRTHSIPDSIGVVQAGVSHWGQIVNLSLDPGLTLIDVEVNETMQPESGWRKPPPPSRAPRGRLAGWPAAQLQLF